MGKHVVKTRFLTQTKAKRNEKNVPPAFSKAFSAALISAGFAAGFAAALALAADAAASARSDEAAGAGLGHDGTP